MKKVLITLIFVPVAALFLFSYSSFGDKESEDAGELSCPESCETARRNCEFSCSQMVGGGAKSEKRRECYKSCGDELGECKVRCTNPTPRPTLEPEPYHDKSCENACVFKHKDCNETCTKYVGGGAKSGKKTACLKECSDVLDRCKYLCVNPDPRPEKKPAVFDNNPCSDACRVERIDCEENCSIYAGGGAEGGKKGECIMRCSDAHDGCMGACAE